jgi:hypothetical protein
LKKNLDFEILTVETLPQAGLLNRKEYKTHPTSEPLPVQPAEFAKSAQSMISV